MITNGLIAVLYVVLLAVTSPLRLFADVTSSSSIVSAVTTANGYLAAVPFVYTIIAIIGSMIFLVVFEGFYFTYKGIRWLYRKIPGVS